MVSPNRSRKGSARAQPVRTCIGCRDRVTPSELIRIVAVVSGSAVTAVPDPRRSAPGRGAHLHPSLACLELAVRRKAFTRALRVEGQIELAAVKAYLGDPEGSLTSPPDQVSSTTTSPPGGAHR
ncbi:MAG: YlxR family protein [Nocardioidaceae bacterium]|nr:YlxR family protein [Nocardioidaceae bacterium]